MFSEVFFITFVVIYVLLFTVDCDGLVSHRDERYHRITERELKDTHSQKSDVPKIEEGLSVLNNQFEAERGSFLVSQLVKYLPYCPKSYVVTIRDDSRAAIGKNQANRISIGSGSYDLCQESRQIHLRDEDGERDFVVTDISRSRRQSTSTLSRKTSGNSITPVVAMANSKIDNEESKTDDVEFQDTTCRPTPCSTKQLMAINSKNAMDCGSFYICVMGQHFLLHCPQGHEFSEEYGVCLEKKYANCKLNYLCRL